MCALCAESVCAAPPVGLGGGLLESDSEQMTLEVCECCASVECDMVIDNDDSIGRQWLEDPRAVRQEVGNCVERFADLWGRAFRMSNQSLLDLVFPPPPHGLLSEDRYVAVPILGGDPVLLPERLRDAYRQRGVREYAECHPSVRGLLQFFPHRPAVAEGAQPAPALSLLHGVKQEVSLRNRHDRRVGVVRGLGVAFGEHGELAQLRLLGLNIPHHSVVDRFGLRHVAEQYGESENGLAALVDLEIGEPELGDKDAARTVVELRLNMVGKLSQLRRGLAQPGAQFGGIARWAQLRSANLGAIVFGESCFDGAALDCPLVGVQLDDASG